MQNSFFASFRTRLNRPKAYLVRRAYRLRDSRHVRPALFVATLLHKATRHPGFATLRLHFLYLLNRQEALQDLCRQLTALPGNFSSPPMLLHTILKTAWNIHDRTSLELAVRAVVDNPKPAIANVHFITHRKNASPLMQSAAAEMSATQHRALMSALGRENSDEVAAAIAQLEALEDFSAATAPLLPHADTPAVCRYLAQSAVLAQNWTSAEKWFSRARELAPQDLRNYRALGDLALRHKDAKARIDQILDLRRAAHVREVAFDPLLGQKHLLAQDYLSFLELRDDQVSNQVARAEYKAATRHSMGRRATPFEKTDKAAFVIGRDGVSDEVRWAYYFSQLPKYYKQVSISCDPRLQTLFERSFPTIDFYPVARNWGRAQINADNRLRDKVPHLELATRLDNHAFATSLCADDVMFIEDVATRDWKSRSLLAPPAAGEDPKRYLQPDPHRISHWRTQLDQSSSGMPKVGLIWRSGLIDTARSRHFMALQDLTPLADLDIKLFSLQHHVTLEERELGASMNVQFHDDTIDFYDDFEEIAAFVANLDIVIGISTLPFEMAGAVGTECWLCALSPEGQLLRRGAAGSGPDRLTRNSYVFVPQGEKGYQMAHSDIVSDLITQIQTRILERN